MRVYIYITLLAFVLSGIFCKLLIPLLKKWKAGQNILSYVTEHEGKSGTPTMGGIAFLFATVITAILFVRKAQRTFILTLVIGLAYMAVGLLDDLLKQKHKENLGLRAWQKFSFQAVIAFFCGIYCYRADLTWLYLPFSKMRINIGLWIIPLAIFIFLATVNAVNLTDGLDGLAAGVSVPFFALLGVLVLLEKGTLSEVTISFALTGALLGYLFFNTPPARIFMGDTGSLGLGGFVSSIALFSGNAFYIAIVGICFVSSVLSVVIQVIYYKVTKGKRIFLMAPLHHHFQKKGFSETKIAYAYFVVTLCMGCLYILPFL